MLMKLRRIWIQVTADRKRFGALCVVLAVAMLLWARLIVVARMPRMAIADPASDAANSTEDGGPASPEQPKPIQIVLASQPHHDPFVISPRYFPKPSSLTDSAALAGKSSPQPAEETYQIEARLAAALQAIIEQLRLEAVVSGSLVVINGRTYRVGDSLVCSSKSGQTAQFRVEEVKHRSAVLECEGRRFEIQMASPG